MKRFICLHELQQYHFTLFTVQWDQQFCFSKALHKFYHSKQMLNGKTHIPSNNRKAFGDLLLIISEFTLQIFILTFKLKQTLLKQQISLINLLQIGQMNHRQISLHNIIKQQQSKISQLKEELSLISQLTQTRVLDSQKHYVDQLLERDNVIAYLKQQLDNQRKRTRNEEFIEKQKGLIKVQKSQLEQQSHKYRVLSQKLEKKIQQLQANYKTALQDCQIKINNLLKDNKRLYDEINQNTFSHRTLQLQIDKITKFYKNTMFQIPKRKQTLVWVDNLIKFMQVTQQNSQRKYRQMFEYIKSNLAQMQNELLKSISQVAILQQKINQQNQRIYSQLKSTLEQGTVQQKKINQSIQQLNAVGKREKQLNQKHEYQNLKNSYNQLIQQAKQMQQNLKQKIKLLQSEKKTLVLGFQQIKTFLQNKQTNYREQISMLKQTIKDLLQSADLREKQFQQEVKILSQQIQSISSRYYQNIQYPVHKINQKVQRQIIKIKDQLMKINKQNSFHMALDKLGDKFPLFLQRIDEEEKQNQAIQLCLEKGNQLLNSVGQLLVEINCKKGFERVGRVGSSEKKKPSKSINRIIKEQMTSIRSSKKGQASNKSIKKQQISSRNNITQGQRSSYGRQSSFHDNQIHNYSTIMQDQGQSTQIRQLKQAVSHIQMKQKQNKMQYEINLVKKHNQKLNDHISALEKKIRGLPVNKSLDQKSFSSYFKSQRRIIDLEAQIQQLKQINRDYQNVLKEQVEKIYLKFNQYTKTVKSTRNQQLAILEAVKQLQERHDIIYQMIKIKRQRLEQLQKSFNIINNMLIRPAQTFQSLVKEVANISNVNNLNRTRDGKMLPSISFDGISFKSRLSINEDIIKQYTEILNRRTQINSNGSRYITELIKTLRQTFPIRDNKKKESQSSIFQRQKQNVLKGATGKTKQNSFYHFQKKVKQLQALQFKYKQQYVNKLQKVLQQLTSLQNKKTHKLKLDQNKQKKVSAIIEKTFSNVVEEISTSLEKQKKDLGGFHNSALKDIEGKLKLSVKQNQGLKKEMQIMYLFNNRNNKIEQLKSKSNDNFYQA